MNKVLMLKIVNPLLALCFLVQALTGIMLKFQLGMAFIQITIPLHAYNGSIFILLVLTHFSLNWSWVKATFLTKKAEPAKAQ